MASYSRDQAVTRIAAGQRNLVTSAQLSECGLGKDAVAHRVKGGWLHLVFHGVYAVGGAELLPFARELAALLACGNRSFVSYRSAAFVWGLQERAPAEVEVSVVGRGCRSRPGMRVHRIQAIDKRELRRHEGLWISSPARAVLEVAGGASPDEVADLVSEGVGGRRLTPAELEAVLRRNRGRRGAARLAAVLGDETAVAITRSQAEKAFLKLIRDAGLPWPEVNAKLGPYRPDFMWRKERLIVELDSYSFHGGPRGFQRDRDKDLFYRGAGFDVLRPTREHVVYAPARTLVMVAQALARRAAA